MLQELPDRISSDEERELLSLLCRVHELEADKVSATHKSVPDLPDAIRLSWDECNRNLKLFTTSKDDLFVSHSISSHLGRSAKTDFAVFPFLGFPPSGEDG